MASTGELACVYAALILQDDGLSINAEKIATILKAANVEVEPYWPGLFAKALEGVDVTALITNVGSGVGAAPAAGVGGAVAPAGSGAAASGDAKEEKKKEKEPEPESEEDDDMGFGLFD